MIRKLLAVIAVALLGATASVAHADTIYSNTLSNYAGVECCFQVDVQQVSQKELQLTVTLLDGATFFAGTGNDNHPTFGFNLSGDPSVTLSGYSTTTWSTVTTNTGTNGPDLGSFDYQFDLNSGGTSGKVSTLTFDVTTTSAITASDLVNNSDGIQFVADILGGNNGKTGLSGIVCGPAAHTPEPSSLMLLGTGIIGAAGLMRRRMTAGKN